MTAPTSLDDVRKLSSVPRAGETQLLVERGAMRSALLAALPHASGDVDSPHSRVRVQMVRDAVVAEDDDAEQWVLLVSACDGWTGGVSRVLVEVEQLAGFGDELLEVDLPLESVRDVLAVFKPPAGRDERQAWLSGDLRLAVSAAETTWEEAGPLIDGKQLTVPRLAPMPEESTEYPDLPRVLVEYLGTSKPLAKPSTVNPGLLARFVASAKAFGDYEVVLRHLDKPRGYVVHVGTAFVGLLQTVNERTADSERRRADKLATRSSAWVEMLEPLRRPVPALPPPATVSSLRPLEVVVDGRDVVSIRRPAAEDEERDA